MSGRCWRALPGETQLSFSLFLFFLASPAIESCSKAPWPGWQGRRNSIPLWRRASLPTGHGAWPRRVGEPQSKRFAANELRADTRTKSMEYVPSTGAARTLPYGVKLSCLGSDGGFLVRVTRTFRMALRGGPMKELCAKGHSKSCPSGY